MTLSGTLLTMVTSFAREEMNQRTSKMLMKSLHAKYGALNKINIVKLIINITTAGGNSQLSATTSRF
jgi:hypothetical protein